MTIRLISLRFSLSTSVQPMAADPTESYDPQLNLHRRATTRSIHGWLKSYRKVQRRGVQGLFKEKILN